MTAAAPLTERDAIAVVGGLDFDAFDIDTTNRRIEVRWQSALIEDVILLDVHWGSHRRSAADLYWLMPEGMGDRQATRLFCRRTTAITPSSRLDREIDRRAGLGEPIRCTWSTTLVQFDLNANLRDAVDTMLQIVQWLARNAGERSLRALGDIGAAHDRAQQLGPLNIVAFRAKRELSREPDFP